MKNYYTKKPFIVEFKDGSDVEVQAQDAIEAEHVAGLAKHRAGESSAVSGVKPKGS